MVFYRKYRPQKIEELDSEKVRETLSAVLSKKNSTHAYLFTGPKGLGKTSAARIVAKILNCEKVSKEGKVSKVSKGEKDIEPCNKCFQCISITNGTNLDVLEIDAASNRGIDEIRDLRDKIRLSPVSANKKVYIIDEVHMLTTEAFNALLKTLEEPPSHAVFILCTTEPHKVPETIISRCLHVSFKSATKEELARSLKRIAKNEKIEIDNEAISLIAELSGGGFRDGSKILEEMNTISSGKKISKELIENKFQISNIQFQISNLIKALENKNAKEALIVVQELSNSAIDIKYFIEQLIKELHFNILKNVGINTGLNTESKLSVGELKSLIELLTKAYGEIKYAVLPELPLELTVIGWITEDRKQKTDSRKTEVTESTDSVALSKSAIRPLSSVVSPPKSKDGNNMWKELIERVKTQNHSLAGILRGCSLQDFSKGKAVIGTSFKFHKERLEDGKAREVLENVFHEMTGSKVDIEILLKKI